MNRKIICKYEECNEEANTPHDNEFCIFHSEKDKGITGIEFNDLIFKQIEKGDYNFKGYVFPTGISFMEMVFKKEVDFTWAKFKGKFEEGVFEDLCVVFFDAKFNSKVSFLGAEFSGGEVNFMSAEFTGEETTFVDAKFSGGCVVFSNTKFSGGTANFEGAIFSEGDAIFANVEFSGGSADFESVKFYGGYAYFRGAKFSGGKAYFNGVIFYNDVIFDENKIRYSLDFSGIKLSDKSTFYFKNPKFIEYDENIIITFSDISFNPFYAYFENINYNNKNKKNDDYISPVIIFRYCNLKDVYFTNNDISLFSFYKSAYDEARFYSCEWKKQSGRRKNIICDEELYKKVESIKERKEKEKFKKDYEIEDLNGYNEIATLYRRFKTSLDNTKDYAEAGHFYFNECEMKRKYFKSLKWKGNFWDKLRGKLYWLCKIFMGYGERPLWSFSWFLIFGIIIFPIAHIINGLDVPLGETLCLAAIKYTFSRFLPSTYLPEKWVYIESTGSGFVPFLNSLVLILFVIFIGIGLKRHFRRF